MSAASLGTEVAGAACVDSVAGWGGGLPRRTSTEGVGSVERRESVGRPRDGAEEKQAGCEGPGGGIWDSEAAAGDGTDAASHDEDRTSGSAPAIQAAVAPSPEGDCESGIEPMRARTVAVASSFG